MAAFHYCLFPPNTREQLNGKARRLTLYLTLMSALMHAAAKMTPLDGSDGFPAPQPGGKYVLCWQDPSQNAPLCPWPAGWCSTVEGQSISVDLPAREGENSTLRHISAWKITHYGQPLRALKRSVIIQTGFYETFR